MGDQAGGLVDDQNVPILIDDVQVHGPPLWLVSSGKASAHGHGLAAPDLCLRLAGHRRTHPPGVYPGGEAAAGKFRQQFRQALVQAAAGVFGRNGERGGQGLDKGPGHNGRRYNPRVILGMNMQRILAS